MTRDTRTRERLAEVLQVAREFVADPEWTAAAKLWQRETLAKIDAALATVAQPWWMLHAETCPRYGKVTADATICTCDEATRQRINQAAANEVSAPRSGANRKDRDVR